VTNYGNPIEISGVKISTGDFLVADSDGIVIIPENIIDDVINNAMSKLNQENKMRESILKGMDPHEAYLKYRIF
jgi:regulator of RNase E activity RraA